jgi:hypothetical protein
MKQLSKWRVLAKPFRSSDCDYSEYCKMAPRLCARSMVVAAALFFCYAIYGRPPSRGGAGAQIYSESESGPPSRAGGKAAASDDATKTSVARRRLGAELAGCGLGHFPLLQSFCDIPVLFASENSALTRLCGRLYRGVLVGLWFRIWANYSLAFQNHKT